MHFLIIRLSSLGDIILTQAVVAVLRRNFPNCQITFVCKEAFQDIVQMMGSNIEVLCWRENLSFFKELREQQYDAVIDLHGKLASHLITLFAKASMKYRYHKQRKLRQQIVKHETEESISSTVDLYFSALTELLPGEGWEQPKLYPHLLLKDEVALPAEWQGKKVIAIFAGAAHFTKTYPLAQYRDFLRLAKEDWRFIFLGSEAERELSEATRGSFEAISINKCGAFDLVSLASLLQKVDLVISSDSGPMHLAAALGCRQIAIFGSTHPRLGFAPLNPKAEVLCADLHCQPCTLHGWESCPLGHWDCMTQISPQMLFETVEKSLLS
jgi:heptosyltransferase-2